MKKERIIYLLTVIISLICYLVTNQRYALIMLIFLAAIACISGILLLISVFKVEIDYDVQDTCIIDQKIPVNVRTNVRHRFPVGKILLYMTYENVLFNDARHQKILLKHGRRLKNAYELPFISKDCGKVTIVMEKAVFCDVFGIFSVKVPPAQSKEIVIFPQVTELAIEAKKLPDAPNTGLYYDINKKGSDVTEVYDLRDYYEGDSIRSIHWKLSGKLDKLVVREFGHPSNYQTLIYYDTSLLGIEDGLEYHYLKNAIIGMTISISKGLLKNNLPHHVAAMNHGVWMDMVVENNDSYIDMIWGMMCQKVYEDDKDQAKNFVENGIYQEFSKVVFVTGVIDESYIQTLANHVHVSVIVLTDDDKQHVDQEFNYEIISIPYKHLKEKVHGIEI